MKLVHVQTQIQTVFGVLDDDGNVIPQEPIVGQLPRFSSEAFVEAHDAIKKRRDETIAATEDKAPKPNRTQRRKR